jgi:hypothetical protein
MRRYLVVANQTLVGDHLAEHVRACLGEGPCFFYLLVPASPATGALTSAEEDDVAAAGRRLAEALDRFRELGGEAEGEIGDERPIDAIRDVLRRESFDEIILSTLPPGISRWLGMDLVSRVERAVAIPVLHITAD